ncbi:response regulator [Fulvivirga sedimenti]|uniref:Response regulator transcription factor n=1 Tax=Fulvivirga sedimenti TaxID=2879465 RepID=A0A9X1HW90_9BACT|nr:response regulator transcription factor [Fulvivirga sedimenti]MCA6078806.1 response regulator transcription factor [Fulvivirga sedimenti]
MKRIIIADDHQVVIDGLKSIFHNEDDIEVIDECHNGKELLAKLEEMEPDMVLLDINMPEMNGIEASRAIRQKFPAVKILILSMYDTPEFIRNVINAGASGYVLKNADKKTLLGAIRTVASGEEFFSSEVVHNVMHSFKGQVSHQAVEITEREKDVLRLIAEGLTTNEIAEKLFISVHTVNTHRKNLLSKLDIKNTASLVRYALDQGIV